MSIKLKNTFIIERMITSYKITKSVHDDYDYACITIIVIGGKEYVSEIYYNIKPGSISNDRPTEEWARYYHSVMTKAELNKIIKQLENLK